MPFIVQYNNPVNFGSSATITGNSTYSLQNIVDDAMSNADIAPALPTGGWADSVAISIANDVMNAMLLGGPDGQPLNWKWNRFNLPSFTTISWQQDYFIPGLVNLGWLESAWASDINNTSIPKFKQPLEVHRDLLVTSIQTGYPGKISWMPARLANTGTWGAVPLGPTSTSPQGQLVAGSNIYGLQNPGPNVIYTNPIGQVSQPINATTVITDPNGNLWALTQYGTCGSTQPVWPVSPVYPTSVNPTTVATTVTDGTVVWTAINPNGQALRLYPIPPQTGVVWLIEGVAQAKCPIFTSLTQSLDPIPDDYVIYFKQGFFAQCYRRSPDPKVRAKFADEWKLFLQALDKAVRQGQREMDDFGFVPGSQIMDTGYGYNPVNPANPYGVWGGY